MEFRTERDSIGEIRVPAEALWGAQTERSFENFKIGTEKMPVRVIRAFAILKMAAARVNFKLGKLDADRKNLIEKVCDEITDGLLDGEFPLAVWQTGSGTQTNMNVNEVISNRGNKIAGISLLHPNDHVNMSQSSNDTFPTAMHIAAVTEIKSELIPAVKELIKTFERLEDENKGVVKSGRTHLQDAIPISFSQEISGWRAMLTNSLDEIEASIKGLYKLAIGGTAVGTGLNAPKGFDGLVAESIAEITGEPFITDDNKFYALTSKSASVSCHGAIKGLAANLMKIANDVRWLASGPRLGLGEIYIPENEPGSSIMPGKVNPTQCEALTMVCVQVMGNDTAIGIAASQGNFELNVFMPVIIYNFLQSVRLISDAVNSFNNNCVKGIKPNKEKMRENLYNSLMLVTCISPYIGYDRAAQVAKKAYKENLSLKEACLALGFMDEEKFDEVFKPEETI